MRELESFLIRATVGSVMVAYGISQLHNPKSWLHYEPEWLKSLLQVKPELFMQVHGAQNIGLGLLFISGWRIIFISWATYAWWLSILPFATKVDWRTGARDLAIISAILAVAVSSTRKSSANIKLELSLTSTFVIL